MVYSKAGYYTTHSKNGDKVLLNDSDQYDMKVNS